MEAKPATPPVDRLIAELADAQHGVVALDQLIALGLGRHAIQQRVRRGRLHRVYRAVYAVGRRRINREGWWMAATLTSGGVLSHRSAAALWALTDPIERDEVTIRTSAGRGERNGLTIHRTSSLLKAETTMHDGIPVTTVPRTFVDLAETASRRRLERTLDEAEYQRVLDLTAFQHAIALNSGRAGAKRLARALEGHTVGSTRTNDGLEESFFLLCRDAGLPDPVVKAHIGPYEVDFLWPDARLVVETDDRASHERNATYERDRDRDGHLQEAGYRLRRFTWKKITNEPDEVIRSLKALLPYPANTASTAARSPSEGATATGIRQRSPAARTKPAPGPSS